jgi:spore coat polysaccharide biosynthesis protein SpsF
MVSLAALRAANRGARVIVATSSNPVDDPIAQAVAVAGIECVRGHPSDVLDRYVFALREFEDSTIVHRITADNVFPDGNLIAIMERQFAHNHVHYLCCNGERSHVPYGMAVEVTRVGHLREANKLATSEYDREHVMPWIARRYSEQYWQRDGHHEDGQLRCTVDVLDDYLRVYRVFKPIEDPVAIDGWLLVDALRAQSERPPQ